MYYKMIYNQKNLTAELQNTASRLVPNGYCQEHILSSSSGLGFLFTAGFGPSTEKGWHTAKKLWHSAMSAAVKFAIVGWNGSLF